MKKYNRADFLKIATGRLNNPIAAPSFADGNNGQNVSLNTYNGPWGNKQLIHLLRRCLFGVSHSDLAFFKDKTLDQCLDILLKPTLPPAPPVNAYNDEEYTDPEIPEGKTWVTAKSEGETNTNGKRYGSLKGWWMWRIIEQEKNLTEKMVLFWHNHMPTEILVVKDARYSYKYNALLRRRAMGNFKKLVRDMVTNSAMLVYLNGNTNVKAAPNENFGRELQELFTVGKGPGSHYTEDDVKAAARVLTGWKDNKETLTPYFSPDDHDTNDKQFSAFYNNKVITGKTGLDGAKETDELIDMIFLQPETARFICRKLFRWFVDSDINEQIEANIIEPLSQILIKSNFEVAPVIRSILSSTYFYDEGILGCIIKNPVDNVAGVIRQLGVSIDNELPLSKQYLCYYCLEDGGCKHMGMDIGDPPNVAGWPAYREAPQYYRWWINSEILPYRNSLTDSMASQAGLDAIGALLFFDFLLFTSKFANPADPNKLLDDALALLIPVELGPNDKAYIKGILLSGMEGDHYWTEAWNNFMDNPLNEAYKNTVLTRLRPFYTNILQLAEYQLM